MIFLAERISIGILFAIAVYLLIKGIYGEGILIIAGVILMSMAILYIHMWTERIRFQEHDCMNMWMEGTYECDICYPEDRD